MQLDAFDGVRFPRAHRNDPRSSHEAAAAIERSGKAKSDAIRVYEGAKVHQNHTSAELAQALGMELYAVRRRLTELEAIGKIQRIDPTENTVPCAISGKRVCRWVAR